MQEEFAGCFHILLGTLRDCEQGAVVPDQSARGLPHRNCPRSRGCAQGASLRDCLRSPPRYAYRRYRWSN
jgi:hypothetical protein